MTHQQVLPMESLATHTDQVPLARALGWFSVGLGLTEMTAPEILARFIGVTSRPSLVRLMGLREIVSGMGILSGRNPTDWLWTRVGGDVIDLALLGAAFKSDSANRNRVSAATAAVAGVAALDFLCTREVGRHNGANHGIQFTRSIAVNQPREKIYQFWRNFTNLPRFMSHLKSVEMTGERTSHWTVKAPGGTTVEWDAEIIEDMPNEFISWRSREGAEVENSGIVRFEKACGGRGTIIRVDIRYRPPAGALGATVAKLFGEAPEKQVPVDLSRLKQFLETGEIATTEGQPSGRSRSTSLLYDNFVRG